jgi:hypothetical protein
MSGRGALACLALGLIMAMNGAATAEPLGDETFEGGFACLASSGDRDTGPTVCQSVINPALPSFDFSLVWHVEEGTGLHVLDRIDIRRKGETQPFQSVSPIESSLPKSVANNGFEMIDLNFDGFLDMRVVRFLPAGPNMPYQNWLWSPDDGKFIANSALDDITSPQFDADAQEITSQWRSSASEHGSDIYVYEGMTPVLIHREADTLTPNGACTRTFYDRIDDELRKTGTGACDDSDKN